MEKKFENSIIIIVVILPFLIFVKFLQKLFTKKMQRIQQNNNKKKIDVFGKGRQCFVYVLTRFQHRMKLQPWGTTLYMVARWFSLQKKKSRMLPIITDGPQKVTFKRLNKLLACLCVRGKRSCRRKCH